MAAGPSTLQYVPAAIPTMGMFCNNPSQINQYSQSSQPIFQPITFQQPGNYHNSKFLKLVNFYLGYIFTPLSMKSNTSAFDEQSDYYEHSRVQYTKSQSESEKCDEIAVGRNQNVYRVEVHRILLVCVLTVRLILRKSSLWKNRPCNTSEGV